MNIPERTISIACAAVLLAAGALSPLRAQLAKPEPEIRRAIPITPSSVPTPVPVMRAIPVESPTSPPATSPPPSPSPSRGVSSSLPAASPGPGSQLPSGVKGVAETSRAAAPDAPGSIRIAPSAAADPSALAASQLSVADGFYTRKQHGSAVTEYEKFLIMASRETPGKERALYRLGESQRQMDSSAAAEASFLRLVGEYPSGEFAPSASFRLGELREARGEYPNAADNFARTAKDATDPSIRMAAAYHQALCLEKSGGQEQADALFQSVARKPSTGAAGNPYRIPSLMHLAENAAANGKKEQALEWYGQILSADSPPHGENGEALSEAALKAAQLESELGKPEDARKLLEKVASSKDSGRWQGVAALGAIRLAAQAGDDASVLRNSERALAGDAESKPEILLLRANALRKTGKNARALEDYDLIMREYPGSKAAALAPFQRLLALHAARNPSLLTEIDQYLLTASDPSDRARAQLLKAEETLRASRYKEAASLYREIQLDSLPATLRPDILYKEAWALIQADAQANSQTGTEASDATQALTRFLEAYPDEERAPAALAQRALLRQQKKDFAGAIADFTLLQERYPKATERELALQQKALLLGQQQQNKEMVETFNQLLHDYPKSSAASQAHYWIGCTALDNKDYEAAVAELAQARSGDPKQFAERAGLRILLAEYYRNRPSAAAREAAALKPGLVPPEIARWLGIKMMESGDPAKAERFLYPLVKEGMPGASDQEIQGALASAMTAQGKYREAQAPAAACLKLARDPASRAKALLVAATIQRSMKNLKEASAMADEAMLLQPEGSINGEARILSGDLLFSGQDYASAAKAYMTVAVLYDDPVLTPKALARAVEAYRKAGNLEEARKTSEELRSRFPGIPVPSLPKS